MVNQKNVSKRQASDQYSYHYTTKKVQMQNILSVADSCYGTPEITRISISGGESE